VRLEICSAKVSVTRVTPKSQTPDEKEMSGSCSDRKAKSSVWSWKNSVGLN